MIEESEDIVVSGVEIYNRKNYNTDGLHFSENKRIHIDGCKLDCGDDAIVLNRYAQDVRISRCVISSRWAGVRIGPFSDGRFEDIEISDCKIHHTYGCGIKIQMGQGGIIRNVWVHRIRMEKVTGPVHIRLCHFPGWKKRGYHFYSKGNRCCRRKKMRPVHPGRHLSDRNHIFEKRCDNASG